MGHFQKAGAACVVALFSLSVVAATAPDQKAKRPKGPPIVYTNKSDLKVTDEMKTKFLQFMQLRSVLFTPPMVCVFQTGGVCVIEVPIILVSDASGKEYCVALFPEKASLTGTASTNPEKTIVWSLIPPSPAPVGATFTFFDDKNTVGKAPAIIVLSDNNKQLHNGTLGDGTSTTVDTTKYLIKNKHKVIGDAVYIPVIVRTDSGGKVSVCGTPDPIIANE